MWKIQMCSQMLMTMSLELIKVNLPPKENVEVKIKQTKSTTKLRDSRKGDISEEYCKSLNLSMAGTSHLHSPINSFA